ncbi:SDR family NAD(P)-dependent oxidoreductase [Pseudomonas sp. MAG002Y]|uniref:SDR family NAD(P)-dependent oxidoreductase n=1 Tax=Pseudomonas sp. MAG002Y TaxID=2678690 RepID=UPI002155343C|nr:SDR family NAD(P)-dependent oxidoreductase [Pseudomonas sp. MAG002Y]
MFIVTGGTQGIGAAVVEKLVAEGHQVVFTGRDESAGQALQTRLKTAVFVAGDVLSEQDCQKVVSHAMILGEADCPAWSTVPACPAVVSSPR